MASKRRALIAAAAHVATFGCGCGALMAWQGGYFANCAILALAAATLAAAAARQAGRIGPAAEAQLPPHRLAEEGDVQVLRAMLDRAPSALLSFGPDGYATPVNRAARALFASDGPFRAPPALAAALQGAPERATRTLRLPTPEGEAAFALVLADLVGPSGPLRLAALTNIQPEIRVAEAAGLRDALQVLSHEIMNSLTPIASLAQSAREMVGDGSPEARSAVTEALGTIERRAEGLNRFVQAYRSLAKLPPPNLRAVAGRQFVEDVARLFSSHWGREDIALEIDADGDFQLRIDPDLMAQAVLNILVNAAEACAQRGDRTGRVRLVLRAAGAGFELRIRDNGVGLPSGDGERIFLPFVSTKPNGLGVGLAMARQIVRSHGGDLTAQRREPGAEVVIRI